MRNLQLVALTALFTLVLSGCLVEESDPPKVIERTTNVVRPIVNGDYYTYEVVYGRFTSSSGGGSETPVNGTLTVTYYTDSINLPFGSSTIISVIREETVFNLGGSSFTTRRYIQQNGDGSLQVLAAESGGVLYRTGPKDGTNSDLQPIVYLPSPVPTTGTAKLEFQYLQGCESPGTSTCTPGVVMRFNESLTYYDNQVIQTLAGRFNALRYDFVGSTIPTTSPFGALLDFRTTCSTTQANYTGSTYIFPEVGIVFYDYTCQSLGPVIIGHAFSLSLRSTNVPIPKPQ